MTSITDPEISAFLAAGTRTGKLAYTSADGRPLVVPVWFIVEDGCVVFNTSKKSAKGRALARDRPAGEPHLARGRRELAEHAVEQGRLAAAARSDDAEDFAAFDREGDAVDRAAAAEALAEIIDREERAHGGALAGAAPGFVSSVTRRSPRPMRPVGQNAIRRMTASA